MTSGTATTSSNATSNVTTTTSTQKTEKNKSSENSELFNKLLNNETNPKDISYEEYKNLSRDEINTLYPRDTMEKENNEAVSLHIKTHMTDDEVLNKVLFEKELESFDSLNVKYLKPAIDITNATFEAWNSLTYGMMSFGVEMDQIHNNIIAHTYGAKSSFQEYSHSMEVSVGNMTREFTYNRTSMYTAEQHISATESLVASQIFTTFDTIETKYNMIATENNYNKGSNFYEGMKAVSSYHEEIKGEYYKRESDNRIMLHTYTRSYSHAEFEYSASIQNDTQVTQGDKENESKFPEAKKYSQIISSLLNGDYKTQEDYMLTAMENQQYYENRQKNDKEYIQLTKEHYEGKFSDRNFEEFITKMDMDNLSSDEKNLYKSIIKDRWVTDKEVSTLSFEQLKNISKFYNSSENNDTYIGDTDIPTDYKALKLIEAVNVSNDDVFNNLLFERISSMENNEEISAYMSTVTGSKGYNKESFYHDMTQDSLSSPSKNPKNVLDNLITQTEAKITDDSTPDDKILYESMLGIYTELRDAYIQKKEVAA